MRVPRGVFGPGCREFLARAAFDANFGHSFAAVKINTGGGAAMARRPPHSHGSPIGARPQAPRRRRADHGRRRRSTQFLSASSSSSAPGSIPYAARRREIFGAEMDQFRRRPSELAHPTRPARGPAAPGFPTIEHAQRSREFFETRGDGAGCSDDTAKRSARFFKGAGGKCDPPPPPPRSGILSIRQYSARYYCIRTTPEGGK